MPATAPSARDLFIIDAAPAILPMLRPLVLPGAPIENGPGDDQAAAVLASGGRVELKRSKNGDWGYGGLLKRAEEDKNRKAIDITTGVPRRRHAQDRPADPKGRSATLPGGCQKQFGYLCFEMFGRPGCPRLVRHG